MRAETYVSSYMCVQVKDTADQLEREHQQGNVCVCVCVLVSGMWAWSRFQLGLENLGKMGRHFPVKEKSGNFEQTGKVMENHAKYWKSPGISDKCSIFSDIYMNCVLFTQLHQVFS